MERVQTANIRNVALVGHSSAGKTSLAEAMLYLTKATGGSKYAERGAMIGLIVGIFLTPIGMILGSFLGAFIAEMTYAKKDIESSLKAAFGSFLGFILGTGIKTVVAVLIMWKIIVYAF